MRTTKRALLGRLLEERGVTIVDEQAWDELARGLAPISDDYLRRLLRESGARLSPLVEGVRQETFDELDRTLTALQRVYEECHSRRRPRARRPLPPPGDPGQGPRPVDGPPRDTGPGRNGVLDDGLAGESRGVYPMAAPAQARPRRQ